MKIERGRARRTGVWRFLGMFALCMAVFYAITLSPPFQNGPFQWYLQANATVGAWILDLLGQDASAQGKTIIGREYVLRIERGCDAIEPSALFAAAVIALPVRWRRRLVGLGIGVPVLLIANLVRIVSLYFVGAHWPDAFQTVHVEVWQPLFILLAMLLWLAWALRATRPAPAERAA